MLLTIVFLVPATVLAYFLWRVSTETTRSHSPICVPALFALAGALHGQQMISAKAGLLNHLEGNALLNGYQIMLKPGEFPQIDGSQLTLADVYAALAYYHDHCEDIRESMRQDEEYAEAMRAKTPSKLLQKLTGEHAGNDSLPSG